MSDVKVETPQPSFGRQLPYRGANEAQRPTCLPSMGANEAQRPACFPSMGANEAQRPTCLPYKGANEAQRPTCLPNKGANEAQRPTCLPCRGGAPKGRRGFFRYPGSALLHLLCSLATLAVAAVLVLLVGYIVITGVPHLSLSLFSLDYNSENVSLLPALLNTLLMTALSLVIAVPLGVGGAIYLAEYANRSSRLVKAVRLTAETLSGIPSILYGLFGMMCFVVALKWSYSLLAGGMTLAIMILPLILRTTEEALLAVPESYREGSFGLGAGRLRTVLKIVLPPAGPGILAGVILAIGRVVGETAALIYTAGTVGELPQTLMDSGRTLAVHMYVLSGEGLHVREASATAVVLLVIVAGMNALSAAVAKKMTKG